MLDAADQHCLFYEGNNIMEQIKQYVLRLILLCLIHTLLQNLPQCGPVKELTRLICGLLITLTIISPVLHFDFTGTLDSLLSFPNTANTATEKGKEYAHSALAECIISGTEAYILDKAAALNLSIYASVSVSHDATPIPTSVIITGRVNTDERDALTEILTTQLGIAKENITWIG